MTLSLNGIAGILLVAGVSAAVAAPAIPSSELPGRDRQRFNVSPVERFMQPTQQAEPLIRWQCDERKPRSSKQRAAKPRTRC